MGTRGNKVDAILVCPIVDLQLLLQGCVDQDDNLRERCIQILDKHSDGLPESP
jgi:hypothetical protein